MHKLHKLSEGLQRQKFSRAAADWWESSTFSLLMPLVGPLLCVLLIAILGPFILNRLIGFIRQQVGSVAFKTIQVHYHQLDLADRVLAEPFDDIASTGDA